MSSTKKSDVRASLGFGFSVSAVIAQILLLVSIPAAGYANTAPNVYTPAGVSWINVPEAARVYFEEFGVVGGYDDAGLNHVPAGTTCTFNGVTSTGPFITAEDLGTTHCIDSQSNSVDPIDSATRVGASPFGFPINFFGTTYTSAWANTNGGVFFDAPSSAYNKPIAQIASEGQSSSMMVLSADLYYDEAQSNFWTAQTTIEGRQAVVFAWENFKNCCNNGQTANMSFQLVLINQGNGDFDAYFNYAHFDEFSEGYASPSFLVDLDAGITSGSNIVVTRDSSLATSSCERLDASRVLGTATDSTFTSAVSGKYYKLHDLAANQISLWSDVSCTVPINASNKQSVANDGNAYLQFRLRGTSEKSVGIGWSTYSTTTKKIDWTELIRNIPSSELLSTAANPLTSRMLNTNVPGRFVIGQRGGQTVTDQAALTGAPLTPTSTSTPTPTPTPTPGRALAKTGAEVDWLLTGSLLAIVAGAVLFALGRGRRTE